MPPDPPRPLGIDDPQYRELIAREAAHWGQGEADPHFPQLWSDPALFEISLGAEFRDIIARAARASMILELGCGDGDLSTAIAEANPTARVRGLDLAPERIERGRAWATEHGVADRVTLEVADLNTIELPPAGYQCVVAHDSLHHILALERLIEQVEKTLAPGGTLLVSDFIGAGTLDKLGGAFAYALLPTLQPYRTKWRLRGRLAAFFASERRKRAALEKGGAGLHDTSPFEGISQESIERTIAARFTIVERFTFCPYWYHLVPKLRLPNAWRRGLIGGFRGIDRALNRRGLTRGSYAFIEARKK